VLGEARHVRALGGRQALEELTGSPVGDACSREIPSCGESLGVHVERPQECRATGASRRLVVALQIGPRNGPRAV
jgi:hypothetical protein